MATPSSSSGASRKELKLAAYTAEKYRMRQARLREKQMGSNPSAYPKHHALQDRVPPSVKRLMLDHPSFFVDTPNDENAMPLPPQHAQGRLVSKTRTNTNSTRGLISSIFGKKNKAKKVAVDKDDAAPIAQRMPLSPVKLDNNSVPSPINNEQKKVQDVLNQLLNESAVTPALHRRLSTQRLTMAGMKRRMSVLPSSSVVEPSNDVLKTVKNYIQEVENSWDNDMASFLASARASASNEITNENSIPDESRRAGSVIDNIVVAVSTDEHDTQQALDQHNRSDVEPIPVIVLGSGGGKRQDLRIDTGNFENTDENSNERGSPPSNAKKLNDINSDNSGDESANSELEEDDDDIDDEENENSQTGLLGKCLDYYLRQGVVSLRISGNMIWKIGKSKSATPLHDKDDSDGKSYVNYELQMTCDRHICVESTKDANRTAKGFKMMSLKRFSDFETFSRNLMKAFEEENIKNVGNNFSCSAASALNQAYSDAIRMSSSTFGLNSGSLHGVTFSKGGRVQLCIPQLPSKRLFTSFGRWKEPHFLDQREKHLGEWLDAVLPLQAYQCIKGSPAKSGAVDNLIRKAFREFLLPQWALDTN